MAATAARVEAGQMYRNMELPSTEKLWVEAMKCATEALNRTETTANPESKSPFDVWSGKAEPAPPHPFLQPFVVRKPRRGDKMELKGEVGFYIGPSVEHPSDCVRVVTFDMKILESRGVSWAEVLPAVSVSAVPPYTAPPPVVLQITDQGGLAGPTESRGCKKEDDGAGAAALRPSFGEGGVLLPPIDEDGGEEDDAGNIIEVGVSTTARGMYNPAHPHRRHQIRRRLPQYPTHHPLKRYSPPFGPSNVSFWHIRRGRTIMRSSG